MRQLKTLLIAVAILLGLGSSSAMATLTNIAFDTKSSDGILDPVSEFDWNSNGSGAVYLSNGTQYHPGDLTLSPGQQITFVYQSNLSAFNDATNNPIGGLTDLNNKVSASGYEITIVTTLTEQVNTFTPDGSGGATATFKTLSGTANIYIGTPDSNVLAGTGFDNGTLILVGSIVPGTNSTFTFFSDGDGQGSTKISAIINPTFLDTTYFLTSGDLLPFFNLHDVDFTGQLTIPPGTAATNCFFCGGTGAPFGDLAAISADTFKVDGSNKFTVPEPSSLLLLGSGLLGLSGILRRKSKKTS